MSPRFSVGEEAILQSKDSPEFNGEYDIQDIVKVGDYYKCRNTGKQLKARGGSGRYGYRLEGVLGLSESQLEMLWDESTLRKKHKPSDESFTEMMQSLKVNTGTVTITSFDMD